MYIPVWFLIVAFLYFGLVKPLAELRAELKRLNKLNKKPPTDDEDPMFASTSILPTKLALERLEYRYQVMSDPNAKRNALGLPVELFPEEPQEPRTFVNPRKEPVLPKEPEATINWTKIKERHRQHVTGQFRLK
jgi:hypothetical protein